MPSLPIRNPTYILVPNWHFNRGGPIDLGNIIADPLHPQIVLSRPDPEAKITPPSLSRHFDENWQLQLGSGAGVNASLFANFVNSVGIKLGFKHKNQQTTGYKTEGLETVYYTDMPSPALVKERVKDPLITEMMRLSNPMSKPVYMITGLKIATKFSLAANGTSINGGEVGGSGPAGGPATVGGEASVDFTNDHNLKIDSKDDIIFAYQLMRIKPKGWKNKTLESSQYESSANFLGDDEEEDPEPEVDTDFPEVQDFKEIDTSLTDTKLKEQEENGETEYNCIAFSETH